MRSTALTRRLDQIEKKLSILRDLDSNFKIFGASKHRYRFGSVLSQMQLAAICDPLGMTLPVEYAMFITSLGNGGPGPDFGLYSLDEALRRAGTRNWSVEFPHRTAWQPLFGGHTWSSLKAAGQLTDYMNTPIKHEQEESYRLWQDYYYSSDHTQGSLPISDGGCGHEALLIIGGTESGAIWSDGRVSDGGVFPISPSFFKVGS